jgi:hypothetical protein
MKTNMKKTAIIIIIVAVIVAAVVAFFIFKNKTPNDEAVNPKDTQTTYVEYPDVDRFFNDNSDVQQIVDVSDSSDILTEEEVFTDIENRGFTDFYVTTEYDMSGTYYKAEEIAPDGKDKHPIYNAVCTTQNGNIWELSYVNNQIIATPTSYLMESEREVSVIVSESDTVTSYDSLGNRYFVTIPHTDYAVVKVVDAIDAETLNSLTSEELENL